MNIKEFISAFRNVTHDLGDPPFWSDKEIVDYLNAAVSEASRRALLVSDDVLLPVSANERLVPLSETIILPRRAHLQSHGKPLRVASWRQIEQLDEAWASATQGTPSAMIPDYRTGFVLLYPTPSVADTLVCNAFVVPCRLAAGDMQSEPGLPALLHRQLLDHMLELAYAKHDADAFDPNASAFYAQRFTATFGPAVSVVAETAAARDTSRERHALPR